VADLGCGRGEWLELLGEWGVEATGVDLNAPNVAGMRARGLNVHHADALGWLRAQPEASFAAVTSFHVIEHLPFGVLLRLVQEARRVLMPGGRLIMETPNPENVIVATQTFWLDPTHVRPLPPALLEVVVIDAGLEIEALLRLNPPGDGQDIADPTLRALMTQGRDCAVVARKPVGAEAA
jgi:SAM-dependent methyltransferase